MLASANLTRTWLLLAFALCTSLYGAPVFAAKLSETQKIEALIAEVAELPNAAFLRNDEAHPAKAAAEHLRMKWNKAGKRVKTAQDFIHLCASQSYLSGKPYRIRFGNGQEMDAGPWLRQRLAALEAGAL